MPNDEITDARDADELIRVLREEMVPLFYNRDADGLPPAVDRAR